MGCLLTFLSLYWLHDQFKLLLNIEAKYVQRYPVRTNEASWSWKIIFTWFVWTLHGPNDQTYVQGQPWEQNHYYWSKHVLVNYNVAYHMLQSILLGYRSYFSFKLDNIYLIKLSCDLVSSILCERSTCNNLISAHWDMPFSFSFQYFPRLHSENCLRNSLDFHFHVLKMC